MKLEHKPRYAVLKLGSFKTRSFYPLTTKLIRRTSKKDHSTFSVTGSFSMVYFKIRITILVCVLRQMWASQ